MNSLLSALRHNFQPIFEYRCFTFKLVEASYLRTIIHLMIYQTLTVSPYPTSTIQSMPRNACFACAKSADSRLFVFHKKCACKTFMRTFLQGAFAFMRFIHCASECFALIVDWYSHWQHSDKIVRTCMFALSSEIALCENECQQKHPPIS